MTERHVPVDAVVALAARISAGELTHDEAEAILDEIATEGDDDD